MQESLRPRLLVERYMDGQISIDDIPTYTNGDRTYRFPHCEPRVLHTPEECVYCREATDLQTERRDLDVSNTGVANRLWACPSERARSLKTMNLWPGNRPQSE